MIFHVGKIDAACDQLDWAIRLLIEHNAFVPAITLAGAAEEMLGKAVGDKSAFNQLIDSLPKKYGIPKKVVSQQHLNKARNWLKHWDKETGEPEYEDFELEAEAVQHIVRAIANLIALDQSIPSEGLRFFEWLSQHRKG